MIQIIKNNIQKVSQEDNHILISLKNKGSLKIPLDEEIELIEYVPQEISIGNFVDNYIPEELDEDISREINDEYYARSFNRNSGIIEFKQIYAVEKHLRKNDLYTLSTKRNQEVTVTEDHSLFSDFDEDLGIYPEISVSKDKIENIIIDSDSDKVISEGIYDIKKREDLQDKYVYDVSVKDNENFMLSNGIFVHNSPFSNVSLYCRKTIMNMFKHYRYPDSSSPLDIMDTIMAIQDVFMKFMSRKDPVSGVPYRFPIVTCNLYVDEKTKEVEDKYFLNNLAESNTEGIFNIYITSDKAKISSCCRMVNDKTELMKFKGIDSFGNGGLNIGSHRVMTINLVRLARKSKSIDEFKDRLKNAMFDVAKLLVAHRALIKDRIEQNFLQFFKPLNWLDLDSMFFSTIGLNGIYEAFKYLGIDLIEFQDEAIEIFEFCSEIVNDLANTYQAPFNLEQIPGEGASVNLAKKDKVYFGNSEDILYSNQFVPLWEDIDLVLRAKIDGKLSKFFGGGVISHLNISAATSKEQMISLISFATQCGLDHFALNACFSKCINGHVTASNIDICPICGEKTIDKYSRIVGYFVPVNNWLKERRVFEFPRRKFSELDISGFDKTETGD